MPLPWTILAKPSGADCNLACEYCFYLNKSGLYPSGRLRMSEQVLEAYIHQLLACSPDEEVRLSWQGGEPTLMGLDFFQRSVDLVRKYRRPGQRVRYSLQTNGILLDDAWCSFFNQHNFLIGLSLDGPRPMHDAFRLDRGGQGSFERAVRAWQLLQAHQVETNILCTLHSANTAHPLEVYRFFRDELQVRFIQFIPVVERPPEAGAVGDDPRRSLRAGEHSVESRQFGRFLVEVFDEWIRRDVGTVFIQLFDSALASWCHLPASVCVYQEVCGTALVLEHNGDLYSCDHFVDPGHLLGNILKTPLDELAGLARQRAFGLEKRAGLPSKCLRCDVLFACRGECPRNRFQTVPGGEEHGLNYLCDGYRMFFRHVDPAMRAMADLLRRGRAPAEIMRS
jgi:uncharacterized protein